MTSKLMFIINTLIVKYIYQKSTIKRGNLVYKTKLLLSIITDIIKHTLSYTITYKTNVSIKVQFKKVKINVCVI